MTYVEGETVGDGTRTPWPAWCWSHDTLIEVADWLRDYHLIVQSFDAVDRVWRFDRSLRPGMVVCHNDIAPYNVVWSGGVAAFIDWDIAAPGDPLWDVAQAAWQFAPLHHPDLANALGADPEEAPARARWLLDAYGVEEPMAFADLIPDRIRGRIEGIETRAITDPGFARLAANHVPELRRTLAYVGTRRDMLSAAFS